MWLDIPDSYKSRSYHTFLDVGAYDGDTLGYFHDRFNCAKGIAVEANTSLFGHIHSIAASYQQGIDILPMAAWSRNTRLKFQEVRGGMIQVTESLDGDLLAAPIDDYVQQQVDCIKMDIEGAETNALAGSAIILANSQPDLAIAAYHRPQDLVALYHQITQLGYGEHFQWHFGHYSDCIDDSIYYVLARAESQICT
jgi:FkbM family methyltransferase